MVKIRLFKTIERVIGAKFKLVMIIGIPLLIITVLSLSHSILSIFNISPFSRESEILSITVDVQEDIIREVFRVTALEIESTNTTHIEIVPDGIINPGIITFLLEYESLVGFGVSDVSQIKMRRIGDFIFIDESSINIEVISTSVRNFRRIGTFRSNPIVRINNSVIDQMFVAQSNYEATAAQRLNNERNIQAAKRNFISTFEAVCSGLGLTVIWE